MTEKTITAAYANDQSLRALYETSFPEEEQIPWDNLMALLERMALDFTAYYEDDRLVGFTILHPHKEFNWFWYFAVSEELRGQGYGQQILSRLIEKYKGQTTILDLEAPEQPCDNAEQRRRRHALYLRNGFRDTGVSRSFLGVDYNFMINGQGTFTLRDYQKLLLEIRSYWVSQDAIPTPSNPT